jgi:AcrR family transcriptional regulator
MARDPKLTDAYKAFADRRRDPDGKREAILRTAVQLFLDRSYARTSLNDIADKLKITKPALYHYFRNKEDILLECYRWGCLLIREFLDDIVAHGGTGLQKVESFIRSYTSLISGDFGRAVIRLDDSELSRDARTEIRTYKREIDRRLRSFIEEGIRDGSIAGCDPKLASFAIAGAINWVCMWYKPGGSLSPAQLAAGFAATLINGLRSHDAPLRGSDTENSGNLQLVGTKSRKNTR